ncbi:probable myosin light chain kinase DDB_G0292624 [Galendromus occidentalis]|uniref:Probable myosin light chain kinase DDB_G0292624 n=1 Tax=Galendromus occidentalis TaxID=34638 RepID=A0AAJ6QSE6_9ACAR|nr:probable myosin light chain kinase DDB_G0292624 [Galendromus occidentalis]
MKLVIDEQIKLGIGQTSVVYHGTLNAESIAAKKSTNGSSLCDESRILKIFKHKNVVKHRGLFELAGGDCLIMELALGGTLAEHLGYGKFSPTQKKSLIQQISSGLGHIHDKGIVHRDLKAENLLFKDMMREHIVIADFGSAQSYRDDVYAENDHEDVDDDEYTFKSDVYLLGLVAFQILRDLRHFDRRRLTGAVLHQGYLDNQDVCGSWEMWRMIIQSLDREPEKRPTVMEFFAAFGAPPA